MRLLFMATLLVTGYVLGVTKGDEWNNIAKCKVYSKAPQLSEVLDLNVVEKSNCKMKDLSRSLSGE